jgi:chromosome partitioning protein
VTTFDQLGVFRRIAEVIRSAQRAAIEVENAPEKRKRLRTFSVQEVASLLDVTIRDLNVAHARTSDGRAAALRARLTFSDLQEVRREFRSSTGLDRFLPRRRPERGEELATVVFTNFKGGSGKTTSSVHFAQYMALAGYRVLLVDLDSQGSATAQFGIDPATEVGLENSFAAWTTTRESAIRVDLATLCQPTYWPAIDLVPAGAVLAQAEEALSRRAASSQSTELLYFDELARFLALVESQYDVAVVDTRPDVNMLMTTALHAATGIVVPTRATMTDLGSTGEFFAHLTSYITDFRAAFGSGLDLTFGKILVTAYDPTDRSQEALVSIIRERFGDAVLPGEFLHSRIMGTAGFGKETLYEYEPTTDRAAYNRVVNSVNSVNRAIEYEVLRFWERESDWQALGKEAMR